MVSDHTVRSFTVELKQLDRSIDQMGKLTISQIGNAMKAITSRDVELAEAVVQKDQVVDDWEHEVDTLTVKLLALRQPVAFDLRVIVSALRMSIDLERIADYAANIAKRVKELNQVPMQEPVEIIVRMGGWAQDMIADALKAYLERDSDLALQVWHRDDEIDRLYTSLLCKLRGYMAEDSRLIGACSTLLLVAKSMERIGDHITNIAEHIQYLVRGTCRHQMVRDAPRVECPQN
jgi:phosphate transport system protein